MNGEFFSNLLVVDGVLASIGSTSTNLDNRFFALNEEINLVVYDARIAAQLEKRFQEELKHSKEITYEAWNSRPLGEKILELVTLPG